MLLEQFSFECRKVIDFALTALPVGLVFTSNASTSASNRDDPSENDQSRAISSTSTIIRAFRHFGKLFRCEAIWIQCFHWPNLSTFMPEWYFVFTFCSARGCMQWWWERLPLTAVAWVRFPDPALHVGWVRCWFSSLAPVSRKWTR